MLTPSILFLIAFISLKQVHCLLDCNFERYISGCFAQGNFECDTETNKCRCHSQTPILIDGRLCVKRVRPFDSCHYDRQCDNERGFHCYAWPPEGPELEVECQAAHHAGGCQCRLSSSNDLQLDEEIANQRQNGNKLESYRYNKQTLGAFQSQNSQTHSAHNHGSQHQHQNSRDAERNNSNSSSSHYSLAALLSRFVWISLILVSLGLITLLLLIKYQSFRTVERPFHRAEDRVSISSELDAPPPYEVAIRMKD